MSWPQIVTLAETASAVAVVISLAYLALQVRNQVKECRMSVVNSLTQQWGEALQAFALHPDLYGIWIRGLENFEALSPEERGRFSAIVVTLTQIFESLHLHYLDGKVDPELWAGFDRRLCDVFATPGVQAWWRLRRHWHGRRFQQHVDAAIASCGDYDGRYVALYGKPGGPAVAPAAAGTA